MLEPVILPDAMLNQARLWRDECLRRWTDEGVFPRMGEAVFASPVDGESRKVVLHLGCGDFPKAKTFCGIRSEIGEVIGDGYTVVLNTWRIDMQREALMHILLHELTHTVDPYFREDIDRQEAEGRLTDPTALYNLSSEQRAFTAMWTEDLREDLVRGQYCSPGASVLLYRQRSFEFDGFWCYGQLRRPELVEQTEEHFRSIVQDLRGR